MAISALPVLTYPNVRCAPVLEIHHFARFARFSARPDLNLNRPWRIASKKCSRISEKAMRKQESEADSRIPKSGSLLEQFQEKWIPVFRPELRQNKDLEWISDSMKS